MELTTIVISTLGALIVGGVLASLNQKKRETQESRHNTPPAVGNVDKLFDEHVSEKRKIVLEEIESVKPSIVTPVDEIESAKSHAPEPENITVKPVTKPSANQPLAVFHLMAGENKFYGGYDLLQALLSQGLRFGEMNIFHRFQDRNGHGPILFSLAQATEPGTFNIHHMGSLNCKGLSFFMQLSGHSEIDESRFSLMIDTIQALKQELGGKIIDDNKKEVGTDALIRCKKVIRDLAS